MKILSAILGFILIAFGFVCMFSPVSTFLATGHFICICMLIFGIVGIIRMAVTKIVRPLNLIVSILAIVFGIIAVVMPSSTLVFDGLIVYLMIIWFLIYGVFAIITAIRAKNYEKGWGWGLAAGIFGIITAILCIINPMAAVVAIGILIGMFFVETGWGLLAFASFGSAVDGYLRTAVATQAEAAAEAAEEAEADVAEAAEEMKADATEAAEEVKADAAEAAEEVKADAAEAAEEVKADAAEAAEEKAADAVDDIKDNIE